MTRPDRTCWQYFTQFPPPFVRLLARQGSGGATAAITDAELAIRSGLSIDRVRAISRMPNWDEVAIGEARKFFEACGFDPTCANHRQRVAVYEAVCRRRNSAPFFYLRRSPKWEGEFLPLIQLLPSLLPASNSLIPSTSAAIRRAS